MTERLTIELIKTLRLAMGNWPTTLRLAFLIVTLTIASSAVRWLT